MLQLYQPLWESIKKVHLSLCGSFVPEDIIRHIKKRLFLHYSNRILREALEGGKWDYDPEFPIPRLILNPQHHLFHYYSIRVPPQSELVWYEIPKTEHLKVEVNQLFYYPRQHVINTVIHVTKSTATSDFALFTYLNFFALVLVLFWTFDYFRDSGSILVESIRLLSYAIFRFMFVLLQIITFGFAGAVMKLPPY